tara:strand:- start:252 stop:431 length:180 start_codon:yes stop_codon:yes gene_type:complete
LGLALFIIYLYFLQVGDVVRAWAAVAGKVRDPSSLLQDIYTILNYNMLFVLIEADLTVL